jgi:hypothetical protein
MKLHRQEMHSSVAIEREDSAGVNMRSDESVP